MTTVINNLSNQSTNNITSYIYIYLYYIIDIYAFHTHCTGLSQHVLYTYTLNWENVGP